MKKTFLSKSLVVSGVFALLAYLLLSVPVKAQASSGSVKFESFKICYNGSLVQKPFYYGTLYTANWRYRFRIRNYSSQKASGSICYSDAFSLGRDYCYTRQVFSVGPNSYVDVYNTATNTYVGAMGFGLHQNGTGDNDPYYFVDVRFPSFLVPCSK